MNVFCGGMGGTAETVFMMIWCSFWHKSAFNPEQTTSYHRGKPIVMASISLTKQLSGMLSYTYLCSLPFSFTAGLYVHQNESVNVTEEDSYQILSSEVLFNEWIL